MTPPTIITERLILRGPHEDDEAAFVDFFGSERSYFTGGPMPDYRASLYFCSQFGHWQTRGFGLFTITRDGAPIGMAGPFFPAGWPERELGWFLYYGAEGHGYAEEAARATLTFAYSRLGWSTAVSYIAPGNARSIALAERLGCTRDEGAPRRKGSDNLIYRHPEPKDRP